MSDQKRNCLNYETNILITATKEKVKKNKVNEKKNIKLLKQPQQVELLHLHLSKTRSSSTLVEANHSSHSDEGDTSCSMDEE